MTGPSKRDILLALAAIAAGAAAPALAQAPAVDLSAGRAIGEAYVAANPGGSIDMLRAARLPNGLNAEAITRLRVRAAADFREGRIFVHRGWRLSETEAQLFALLAL